jgi:protoporphyrinogen oxidase
MDSVQYLVVGAGMSGLSFANSIREEARKRGKNAPSVLVLEADDSPGGYCKTIKDSGFVWDYSGHFFHFKHPEIEEWLRARMPSGTGADGKEAVATVQRDSRIRFAGGEIDFPFQKNIHQLPRADFIDCLHDLYFRDASAGAGDQPPAPPANFGDMLVRRFGRGIAERFLVPYNEKLYATDLSRLDVDAMGRFFPHADIGDVIRNMKAPDNGSYNSSFTYPRGGAIEYVKAFLVDLPPETISYQERLVSIDPSTRTATTSKRTIRFDKLVSSAPLDKLVTMCGLPFDAGAFTYNRVLVFNLGFDRKGPKGVHWMYFPDREVSFYRVGFYDNIFGDDRMSLYIEIGRPKDGPIDVPALKARVLADLAREKIIDGHQLVASHHVVMDPAYVHITKGSLAEVARLRPILAAAGVYPVGRYGGWTYCSIEDNILETRALARTLGAVL